MKVTIESRADERLSESIGEAVRAVMSAAVADGADREYIREEIAKAIGVTKLKRKVPRKIKARFLADAVDEANQIYASVVDRCIDDVTDLLYEAAKSAKSEHYMKQVSG